jgi:phosphohistidine phosphatase
VKSGRFIVLLRHGIAEDRTADQPDEERRLTGQGRRRMKQIARSLAAIFPEAEAIYSSPLIRCIETSEMVAKSYGELRVETTDALRPAANTGGFRKVLSEASAQFAIFVGHEPNLTRIMLDLTQTKTDSPIALKKGGCYGLALEGSSASLEWMLPPRVLRKRP